MKIFVSFMYTTSDALGKTIDTGVGNAEMEVTREPQNYCDIQIVEERLKKEFICASAKIITWRRFQE